MQCSDARGPWNHCSWPSPLGEQLWHALDDAAGTSANEGIPPMRDPCRCVRRVDDSNPDRHCLERREVTLYADL